MRGLLYGGLTEYFSVGFLFVCRSDFSRRSLKFPDRARDISCHAGQAGQVSGHDPTLNPLLHQVLPQHIPDRSHTPLSFLLINSNIAKLKIIYGGFFFLSFCLSPCSWSVLWRVLPRDVPSVSAVRLPLSGAGLLEGQTSR